MHRLLNVSGSTTIVCLFADAIRRWNGGIRRHRGAPRFGCVAQFPLISSIHPGSLCFGRHGVRRKDA